MPVFKYKILTECRAILELKVHVCLENQFARHCYWFKKVIKRRVQNKFLMPEKLFDVKYVIIMWYAGASFG